VKGSGSLHHHLFFNILFSLAENTGEGHSQSGMVFTAKCRYEAAVFHFENVFIEHNSLGQKWKSLNN